MKKTIFLLLTFLLLLTWYRFQVPKAVNVGDIVEPVFGAGGDVIFNDTFTESVATLLDAHTPDTGTSWTKVFNNEGDDDLEVIITGLLSSEASDVSAGAAYTADATYASADYQVQYTCVDCKSSDDYVYGIIRSTAAFDENNGAYVVYDTSDQTTDNPILARVTGTASCAQLDILDQGQISQSEFTSNTVVIFQAIGSEIAVFADNVASLFATDANITAAGKGGIGMGALPCDTFGDFVSAQYVDNFSSLSIAGSATSYNAPTTNGEISNDWTNPANAYSDDGSYAEEDDVGGKQDYGDFGFSIPAGSTIRGIQVKVEGESGGGGNWVELGVEVSIDNGSTWSSQLKGRYQLSTPDIYLFGHANYLWGLTWTVGDTADTDFRVRLTHTASELVTAGRDMEVDFVAVKIFYDAGASTEADPARQNIMFIESD